MASATSILSLFDLYHRTFGDSHVVLSLAYSIYTAASIFLLEIQALKYAAPGTIDKLKFCISALERVKATNPVIITAINGIYSELQKLQINIQVPMSVPPESTQEHPQHHQPPHLHHNQPHHSQSPSTGSNRSRHDSPSQRHHQPVSSMTSHGQHTASETPSSMQGYGSFQHAGTAFNTSRSYEVPHMPPTHLLGGMPNAAMTMEDPGSYEITPEVYEAFSYTQPITTNMTPAFERGWGGQD